MGIRWGIVSTANIARAFVRPVQASGTATVVAVASRSREKAEAFGEELGIPVRYGSYEALLADSSIDAVYIGLPNSLHAEWTMRAAQAGKHVLCEKPLARTPAEAQQMFAAADAAGVKLAEAFMYRCHPRTHRIRELLAEGAIGQVRLIRASFCFAISSPANIRLSAELAGGALMDVGCYCVNAARMVAGNAPLTASATANWAASGVDETLAGTLTYPGGIIAEISCSLAASRVATLQILGSDGIIETDDAFTPAPDAPTTLRVLRGARNAVAETLTFAPLNQYLAEADAFAAFIPTEEREWAAMSRQETLDNLAAIGALLQSARTGLPVEITP